MAIRTANATARKKPKELTGKAESRGISHGIATGTHQETRNQRKRGSRRAVPRHVPPGRMNRRTDQNGALSFTRTARSRHSSPAADVPAPLAGGSFRPPVLTKRICRFPGSPANALLPLSDNQPFLSGQESAESRLSGAVDAARKRIWFCQRPSGRVCRQPILRIPAFRQGYRWLLTQAALPMPARPGTKVIKEAADLRFRPYLLIDSRSSRICRREDSKAVVLVPFRQFFAKKQLT
jgi:hypothetical protein